MSDAVIFALLLAIFVVMSHNTADAQVRQANDYVAWRYLAMLFSKPSVIILAGRLRPMKMIRLSRFSPGFHGR
jgi:heme/copper-type cytochrome/quinol oxidase subunit 3